MQDSTMCYIILLNDVIVCFSLLWEFVVKQIVHVDLAEVAGLLLFKGSTVLICGQLIVSNLIPSLPSSPKELWEPLWRSLESSWSEACVMVDCKIHSTLLYAISSLISYLLATPKHFFKMQMYFIGSALIILYKINLL